VGVAEARKELDIAAMHDRKKRRRVGTELQKLFSNLASALTEKMRLLKVWKPKH
jgi:hypothetical protein